MGEEEGEEAGKGKRKKRGKRGKRGKRKREREGQGFELGYWGDEDEGRELVRRD